MKATALLLGLAVALMLQYPTNAQDVYWTKQVINESPLPGATGVGTGDLNGSHYADVIVAAIDPGDRVVWYENPYPPPVPVFWAEHGVDAMADGAREVAIADIDRDDDLDIVMAVRDENRIVWYENSFVSPDETWPMYEVGILEAPRGVFTAYINADTLLDIVAGGMAESTVVWYEAPEDPTSDAWIEHTVDDSLRGVKGVFALDMDDDSDVDIVAAGRDCNDVVWYEQISSDPEDWQKHFIDTDLLGAVSVWSGDLVGDARPEVAVTAKGAGRVVVYEQPDQAGDTWKPTVIDSFLVEACPIHGADFDRDGHMDIAAAGKMAQTVAWYKSPGVTGRAWQKTIIDTMAGSCMGLITGDLDGDDYIDIVTTSNEGAVTWYRNDIAAGVPDSRIASTALPLSVWPNPWRDSVAFSMNGQGAGSSARLSIFDTRGRLVWRSSTVQSGGQTPRLQWDGTSLDGQVVQPGVYFYHIESLGNKYSGKMVRLR